MQTTNSRRRTQGGARRRRPFSSSSRPDRAKRDFSRGSRSGGGRSRGGKRVQPTFDPTQFINTNPTEYKEEVFVPKHTFNDFKISKDLKEVIAKRGLTTPSPIQDQAIPEALIGHDVVGLAETGTGKTAAFLIPLIERTKHNKRGITLILTPTRELAIQVDNEFKIFGAGTGFRSVVCVGGTGIGPQIRQLGRRNNFIIGTPGRIKDLIDRGKIPTHAINAVVLDEADRMLDMGFIHDMRYILGELTTERQTLLFSATMDDAAEKLVADFAKDPVTISVKKKDVTDSIKQDVVTFSPETKFETLTNLLADDSFRRVIIFGGMKHSVEKLGKELSRHGIKAESIHGNKSHGQRQRALSAFKSGNARVLVATDVAARGIHVDNVTHVINYDLPNTFADYVHRIGRTGRGDMRGEALTFVPKRG